MDFFLHHTLSLLLELLYFLLLLFPPFIFNRLHQLETPLLIQWFPRWISLYFIIKGIFFFKFMVTREPTTMAKYAFFPLYFSPYFGVFKPKYEHALCFLTSQPTKFIYVGSHLQSKVKQPLD